MPRSTPTWRLTGTPSIFRDGNAWLCAPERSQGEADLAYALSSQVLRKASRSALLPGICEEQLLAFYLVGADGFLSLAGQHPIDEGLPKILLDTRVLLRVHENDAVLIEQALVSFHRDFHVTFVL